MKKRIVVKIGSSTLTGNTDKISRGKIEDLARQIISLKDEFEIIIVSSGAIATAKQFTSFNDANNGVIAKQAMAAIGQPLLMQIYNEVFRDYNLRIAQCLLTYRDFDNSESELNTRNTINELLLHGYIPIINENDTVATEEIKFGDNDKLSALVAKCTNADLLILASDIDGLYDKNPHLHNDAKLIEEVTDLAEVFNFIEEKESALGTGGMTTKFKAVEICKNSNIEMWIVNGGPSDFICNAITNKIKFTKFSI